jgi:tetratricopeptide (TPR) repeat protein
MEQIQRASGQGRHEQYRTRFNQYKPLMELGRLDEARQVLEACLAVFREVEDLQAQSAALSALAGVWAERGEMDQAVALARQALEVKNRLPDPGGRAISHVNLSIYLRRIGNKEESTPHFLGAGIYCLASGRGDLLKRWLNNLRIFVEQAAQTDTPYTLPRIADFIVLHEFEALNRFLVQYQVDVNALQTQVDELVAGLNRDHHDGKDGL